MTLSLNVSINSQISVLHIIFNCIVLHETVIRIKLTHKINAVPEAETKMWSYGCFCFYHTVGMMSCLTCRFWFHRSGIDFYFFLQERWIVWTTYNQCMRGSFRECKSEPFLDHVKHSKSLMLPSWLIQLVGVQWHMKDRQLLKELFSFVNTLMLLVYF